MRRHGFTTWWYERAMSAYATILLDDAGPVARVTLNRPDKRNPIGPETCGELIDAFTRCRERAEVRVIVLGGAGPAFSAGGDLGAMKPATSTRPASLVELFTTMHDLGKPVIASVHGPAL